MRLERRFFEKTAPLLMSILVVLSQVKTGESQDPDTLIQRLTEEISDSLFANSVQRLQNFDTRYELSDSILPAGQWIHDQFIDMGYDVVTFDSFSWIPTVVDTPIISRNIIATKPGNSDPDSLIILGGHYDSISNLSFVDSNAPAPGANDNATGIAGILEIARILEPCSFEKTIQFTCFAGEEVGYGGSFHHLSVIDQQGIPVRLSCVLDMIGYQENQFSFPVIIDADTAYLNDAYRTAQLGLTYSQLLRPYLTFGYFGSDHWVLGLRGPAILITEESGYSDPVFHTEWDLLDSLSIPYATEILKMALASIVDVASNVTVGIDNSKYSGELLPRTFVLSQNYPNPFNPSTTIEYSMPEHGNLLDVNLEIFDLRGRRVKTFMHLEKGPGRHSVHWDGRNDRGEAVGSGVYLYRMEAGSFVSTKKMVVAR